MPLSTMAAVMLLIAFISGLMDRLLRELHTSRFTAFAFITLAALLRIAEVSFSPEYELNAGCVFTVCVLFAAAAVSDGKACLFALAAAALCAMPASALTRLSNRDAAAMLAALVPLASAIFLRSRPTLLLTAALTPVFSAAWTLLVDFLASGYGTFELNGAMLDVQWIGILYCSLIPELITIKRSASLSVKHGS